MNLILAIDPGPTQSGWVIWAHEQENIVGSGVSSNEDVIKMVYNGRHDVVIEMIASYGMPVGAEVFETCVWIGRFMQVARESVARIPRAAVKLHLCHNARAKDSNVWQALVDRYGNPGTKKKPGRLYGVRSHARAALALAVTYGDNYAR